MTIAPNFGKLQIHFQVIRCPETKNLVSLLVLSRARVCTCMRVHVYACVHVCRPGVHVWVTVCACV